LFAEQRQINIKLKLETRFRCLKLERGEDIEERKEEVVYGADENSLNAL